MNTSHQPNGGDIYSKYRRMLKMGVPLKQVEVAIRMDGLDPNKFNSEENTTDDNHVAQIDANAAFLGGLDMKGDVLDKYRKMVKAGLPLGAVEQKMKQDGVHVDNFPVIPIEKSQIEFKKVDEVKAPSHNNQYNQGAPGATQDILAGLMKAVQAPNLKHLEKKDNDTVIAKVLEAPSLLSHLRHAEQVSNVRHVAVDQPPSTSHLRHVKDHRQETTNKFQANNPSHQAVLGNNKLKHALVQEERLGNSLQIMLDAAKPTSHQSAHPSSKPTAPTTHLEMPINHSKTLPTHPPHHVKETGSKDKIKSPQGTSEIKKPLPNNQIPSPKRGFRKKTTDGESELRSLLEFQKAKLKQELSIQAEIMKKEVHLAAGKVKENPSIKLILEKYDQNVNQLTEAIDSDTAKSIFEGLNTLKDILIQAVEVAQTTPIGIQVINQLNNTHNIVNERLEEMKMKLYIS